MNCNWECVQKSQNIEKMYQYTVLTPKTSHVGLI